MRYPTPALWRCRPVGLAHDGDTLLVYVDRGRDEDSLWDVRLVDVFAPELTQTGGPETREFVRAWIANHGDGSDWPYLLETFRTPKSDKDVMTLSRTVGRVMAADGTTLNYAVQSFIEANGYPGGRGS